MTPISYTPPLTTPEIKEVKEIDLKKELDKALDDLYLETRKMIEDAQAEIDQIKKESENKNGN